MRKINYFGMAVTCLATAFVFMLITSCGATASSSTMKGDAELVTYFLSEDGVNLQFYTKHDVKGENGTIVEEQGYLFLSPGGVATESPNKSLGERKSVDIVIPEKIVYDGVEYTVTSVQLGEHGSYPISSIVLPNTIKKISLKECSILKSIEIPESVESVDCYFCESLENVVIPNSVSEINFRYCRRLKSVNIPNSVTSIEAYSFGNCESLSKVEIPSSVTSIGDGAFYHCKSLVNVEIPQSVTAIGEKAFEGCSSLKSIGIPNAVTVIEAGTFSGCSNLTSIEIPESVTKIGAGAFYGCSLEKIKIPNSVTEINWPFGSCDKLNYIEFPESLAEIGHQDIPLYHDITIKVSRNTIVKPSFNGLIIEYYD